MEKFFTKEGTWWGGFYELAIELGERSDERLFRALDSLWSFPALDGCYVSREIEPPEQTKIAPSEWINNLKSCDESPHLHGTATLTDGNRLFAVP